MRHFGNVLVIVTQQIGDVLLATPLIRAVRAKWPGVCIDVVGFSGTLAPLEGNPDVRSLIEAPRDQRWRGRFALLRRLWRRYDLALVTQKGDRAHLYGWVAAPLRSAPVPLVGPGSRWKGFITQFPQHGTRDVHAVLEKLELLTAWWPAEADPVAVSVVPPRRMLLPPDLRAMLHTPAVMVHAPSRWRYKQWPVSHYRAVISGLLRDGVQVWLTGAGNENDRSLTRSLLDLAAQPDLVDAVGRLDFGQLAELLSSVDAYLGPDTSITHLAAAVGTPVVALFGPTLPTEWGPWPQEHPATNPWLRRGPEPGRIQGAGSLRSPIVLIQGPSRDDRDCVPCGRAGCDDHRDSASQCLERLAPEPVLAEVRSLLRLRGSR